MMKTLFYAFILVGFLICFSDCNPECSSTGNMTISTDFNPAGYEFLIKATPLSTLKNKRVFFDKIQAETRFWDTVGLICKVPANISVGKTTLRVEDDDCVETFNFDVSNNDVFKKNPNYIFPQTPEIIIPTFITSGFPASIDNAWLCPENTDYCIWFSMKKDTLRNPDGTYAKNTDGTFKMKDAPSMNQDKNDKSKNSREACTVCGTCTTVDQSPLYKNNQMYGFHDTTNHILHFWIERVTGVEEFEGRFIEPSKTKYNSTKYKLDCVANEQEKQPFMILLTSKKSGRQTVIFKN